MTDDEILAAYRDLARQEGVFCEPASAASVAGVRKLAAAGQVDPDATVVAVLTGHGLKDPHTAETTGPGSARGRTDARCGRRRAGLDIGSDMVAHWLAAARRPQRHGRGPGLVGQPRGRLRLPRGGAGASPTGSSSRCAAGAAAQIELDGRGRGPQRARARTATTASCAASRRGWSRLAARCRTGWAGGSTMHNKIPLARGLGSSAAATVAGVLAADALLGGGVLDAADAAPPGDRDRGSSGQRRGRAPRRLRRRGGQRTGCRRPALRPTARPASGAVHPGPAAADGRHAQGAARGHAGRGCRGQPRGGRARGRRIGRRPDGPAPTADRRSHP